MEEAQRERLNLAKDILLGIAGVGGILLSTAIAPGAIGLLAPFLKKKYKKSTLKPNHLQKKFNELRKQGLIMIGEQSGEQRGLTPFDLIISTFDTTTLTGRLFVMPTLSVFLV